MALISVHNFTAPFENKTHLFSIVILAAIFGLWRATGGEVTVRTPTAAPAVATESTRASESPLAKTQAATRSFGSPAFGSPAAGRPSSSATNDLDALLQPSAPRSNKANTSQKQGRSPSALRDIETKLGMR